MKREILFLILFFGLCFSSELSGMEIHFLNWSVKVQKDTTLSDQLFNNGRIWRNVYQNAINDQFLFTAEFIPSSITVLGRVYSGIKLKYDICNDELITPSAIGSPIQLNKEMVDSFSIEFGLKTYHFRNLTPDSVAGLKGYFNVIYEGKSAFLLKYSKELYHLSGQNIDVQFFQKTQLFLVLDRSSFPISGKRDLLKAFATKKDIVKGYISKNRIRVVKNDPESFIPVLKYFDSISQ